MTLLILENLPPRLGKGALLRLILDTGLVTRGEVGKIELNAHQALVEVPQERVARLVEVLDGANVQHQLIRARLKRNTGQPPPADEDHFHRLLRLMELEAEAEATQLRESLARFTGPEAERSGQTLLHLAIRDVYGGLGGRVLVTLAKRQLNEPLPWTQLGVGTPVLLSEETEGGDRWRGVVSQLDSAAIQVALDEWLEPGSERTTFRLDLANDEITRQRQRAALERVAVARGDRLAELRQILLGRQAPYFRRDGLYQPLDPTLNESQQEAVCFALTVRDVGLIHGPPGTGKTTTVVEVIRQAVRRGQTVLACAPSNMAVDNMFERLLTAGEKVLRLGHPARVLPELRDHTLDLLVENDPDVRLARKLTREAYALRDQAEKYTRAKPEPGARREMRQEAQEMLDDARRMEAHAVERILDSARILCATTTGLSSAVLGQRRFDLCVLDEAAQSTEPGSWIPLLRCDRLILAGDPYQLPPTIVSPEAARQGYGVSLMERLMQQIGPDIARLLTIQYRMHRAIMDFSSQEFYGGNLRADNSVAGHLLCDLPGVIATELTETPVHFIDTAGASFDEAPEPDGESRFNTQEAALILNKVAALVEAGVAPRDMGVITPYAAQVRLLLEQSKYPDLEINSVDGFQGREKEAILISLVRSNPAGEIGFLVDTRRMNVALTRARRKLLVIGDSATITAHPFYARLVEYFETSGAYHSVWEEL